MWEEEARSWSYGSSHGSWIGLQGGVGRSGIGGGKGFRRSRECVAGGPFPTTKPGTPSEPHLVGEHAGNAYC